MRPWYRVLWPRSSVRSPCRPSPDKLSGEVGGLQNTATNLGAAIGVALAGSILIAALTTSFLQSVTENPDIPSSVKEQASVQLAAGLPFMSDTDLQAALDEAGVAPEVATEAIEANDQVCSSRWWCSSPLHRLGWAVRAFNGSCSESRSRFLS